MLFCSVCGCVQSCVCIGAFIAVAVCVLWLLQRLLTWFRSVSVSLLSFFTIPGTRMFLHIAYIFFLQVVFSFVVLCVGVYLVVCVCECVCYLLRGSVCRCVSDCVRL